MEPSLYEYVMEHLEISNLTYQAIAEGSGVNRRTVEKIARGETKNPGVAHVEALAKFFRGEKQRAAA